MSGITVTVRLFASLREAIGAERVALEVPAGTAAASIWSCLPDVADPAPVGTRYAVNGDWSDPATLLEDGDEIALILPVSGG